MYMSVCTHEVYFHLPYSSNRICIRLFIRCRGVHRSHGFLLFIGYASRTRLIRYRRRRCRRISDGFTFEQLSDLIFLTVFSASAIAELYS